MTVGLAVDVASPASSPGQVPTSLVRGPDPAGVRRQLVLMALVALVLAGAVVGGWFDRRFLLPDPATWHKGRLISSTYDPPVDKIGLYLNQGDGQLFAAAAQDPFLSHPERIHGGAPEEAYRLQRPLYGWLGWLGSGGSPGDVGWSLIVLTVLSAPLLVVGAGFAASRFGASPLWGLLVLAAPGVLADLLRCGPEMLGTALLAFGLAAWLGPNRRTWLAVTCFGLAGLTRETMLLVPATLFLTGAYLARRAPASPPTPTRSRPPVPWAIVLSAVPYVVWVAFLKVHLGALPQGSVSGRLSPVPFGGLAQALPHWRHDEWLAVAVIAALSLSALVARGSGQLRVIVAANLAFASVLGEPVWLHYLDFGRVLLPLVLVSVLVHATASVRARSRGPSGVGPEISAAESSQPLLHPAT